MTPSPLVYPMLAMALLIFAIMVGTLVTRIYHLRLGLVRLSYFRLMKSGAEEVPDVLSRTARNIANQFEVPMLFFSVSLLSIQLGLADENTVRLAWTFVFFRALHAMVHLTYNKVPHRLAMFLVAQVSVMAMWVKVALAVL